MSMLMETKVKRVRFTLVPEAQRKLEIDRLTPSQKTRCILRAQERIAELEEAIVNTAREIEEGIIGPVRKIRRTYPKKRKKT